MSLQKPKKPVKIREVWAQNLESELNLLSTLLETFTIVSMDTEFPGLFHKDTATSHKNPTEYYQILKSNVDMLSLIQLGITLSDANGNLPDLGTDFCYAWQFNFSDFDLSRDPHAAESISLLKEQGMDFEKNKQFGINSTRFAELVMGTGLVCNEDVTWVTFHSAYDFGYLVKILTNRALPSALTEFKALLRAFFGVNVYDVKCMTGFINGLYGGLEKLGGMLRVGRVAGKSHQAGSDSLLTWHVFERMRDVYFVKNGHEKYAGMLYGLQSYLC